MNSLFDLLIIVLLGGSSVLAFFAVLILLLPEPIIKTQRVLEERGGRSLLLGLVNFVFFGLLVLLCAWLGDKFGGVLASILFLIGGLITLALTALMIIGLAALAQLLGARSGKKTTPFITILRGGGLLLLAGLAPYVGWFILTPLALWAGLGAAISALVRKREKAPFLEEAA